MIAYKAANHGDTRVLITLEIPDDATTNLDRKNIAVKETASYRANKVKVLKIEDDNGKNYETAESAFVTGFVEILTYKVGETLVEPNYDPDADKVFTKGIHFFLEKHVAELYKLPLHATWSGVWMAYYYNGVKKHEVMFKDGKKEGLHTSWHENGIKQSEKNFKNGKEDGQYQKWYENGVKEEQVMYKDGLMNGIYTSWYDFGDKKTEQNYKNGKKVSMEESRVDVIV